MAKQRFLSTKRLQIDKANTTVVVILAVASFVTVFSLVASTALLSQRSYQTRVINDKRKALSQLKANNAAAAKLVDSYKVFVGTPDNVIGGSSAGSGDRDGDNAKIILDALPSKYDFPALATSLEKILIAKNFKINSISGLDDEVNQSVGTEAESAKPIEIPFKIDVTSDATNANYLLDVLQKSIRPIYVGKITISGKDNDLTIAISAKTYYQPQKNIKITTKVVK